MSELRTRFIDDAYAEYYATGKHDLAQVYIKAEADKVIADLEESHKKEVGQLLMEIAELRNEADVYKAKYEQEYDIAVHNEKQLSAMRIELKNDFCEKFKDIELEIDK